METSLPIIDQWVQWDVKTTLKCYQRPSKTAQTPKQT